MTSIGKAKKFSEPISTKAPKLEGSITLGEKESEEFEKAEEEYK